MVKNYDIVVLGGGPAGLATAISLLQHGNFSILVADAGSPVRERVGESAPPDLLTPLRRLQLADRFSADGHCVCPGSVVTWGREQLGYNDHLLNPMGPAWRLHRRHFDKMLAGAAIERGATILWNTRYLRMLKEKQPDDGYHIVLSDAVNQQIDIKTRWVVDATGPIARFARDLGIPKKTDDQLFALACFSKIQGGNMAGQTFLESTSGGWWYAARLPDERVVYVYVTTAAELRQIQGNNFLGFQETLKNTRLVGPTLSALQLTVAEYHTFPVYSALLEQVAGENWLAVGDAAACYDPIAAQGLYKAVNDGMIAGRAIAAALNHCKGEELANYAAGVTERYAEYYKNRCYLYNQEKRWENEVFWRERLKSSLQ